MFVLEFSDVIPKKNDAELKVAIRQAEREKDIELDSSLHFFCFFAQILITEHMIPIKGNLHFIPV